MKAVCDSSTKVVSCENVLRRVTVLGCGCVCVCVYVKSHLTSGASVRPEITVTYSAGNGGQTICGGF